MSNSPPAITGETPLRLAEAAEIAFPGGGMTASGLRKEASRGRLVIERIAGKDYTTLAAIADMRKLCVLKPAGRSIAPGSSRSVALTATMELIKERALQQGRQEDAKLMAARITKRERVLFRDCFAAKGSFISTTNHWPRTVRWLKIHGFVETNDDSTFNPSVRITPAGDAEWRRMQRELRNDG